MVSDFEKIKSWVESGEVELTQIVSVPRSISTFFEISLSEAVDGNQINEPFVRTDFDTGISQIHDRLVQLGADDPSTEKPVKLVIKDIAKHLKNFKEYAQLIDNFVFLVRDPHLQMPSFVKRLAHTVDGNSGADYLSLEEAFEKVDKVDALLAKRDYSGTSWVKMNELFEIAKSHTKDTDKTLSVVDGTLLRETPELILQDLCNKIGFEYCDSMVRGEKKAGGKNFCYPNAIDKEIDENGDNKSVWIGGSIVAEEYGQLKDGCYPLTIYSEGIKGHMKDSLEIYQAFLGDADYVGPDEIDEVLDCFKKTSKGYAISFEDRAPTTACAYYKKLSGHSKDERISEAQEVLRSKHNFVFEESFQSIENPDVDVSADVSDRKESIESVIWDGRLHSQKKTAPLVGG